MPCKDLSCNASQCRISICGMEEKTDINITFRVTAELRQAMEDAAAAQQRPLSNWLRVTLAKVLESSAESEGDK